MFGAFSKLFKRSEPAPAATGSTSPQPSPRSAPPLPKDEAVSRPVSKAQSAQAKGADALSIPYSSIIKLIPQELWGKLAPAGVAGYNFTIARKTVLEQLPHGAVKVNFGELRRGAPNGVFVNGSAEDGRMVDLPLSEILAQLHPDALSRRADQTRIEVSPDVPDLFGVKGERLAPLRVMEKKEVSNTSTISRQKGATAFTPKPAAPAPQAPIQPAPPRPATPPPAPAPAIRMQPVQPAAQAPTVSQRPAVTAPISTPKPSSSPLPAAAGRALPKLPTPQPKAAPAPVAAVPISIPPVPMGTPSFFIALDAIASGWPDGIRQELAQLKIPEAKVALPPVEICEGLKRARVQYPWRTLRSWIQPTPIYATPSPFDDTVLELPLRTLTPLFLEFIRSNPVNRQVADADNITEFFKKAERASGTSAELLQPLFDPPTSPEPTPQLQATLPPAGFAAPIPAASQRPVPAPITAPPGSDENQPAVEGDAICLPIATLANGWPEPVMHDIASFSLGGSRIEIPLAAIEPGLKSGRLCFTWRELCGWLNPPSNPAQLSINGETPLALPLGLVAPLFMKARGNGQVRRKTNVDQEIPDLFSAAGKPLNPPQPAAQVPNPSTETPAPAPAPVAAPTPAPKKFPTNLSELFEEPAKKTWTPNEIVQRSTRLPNVAGTLIALQDGLLVAANMPSDLKTETIAAFVPQIFGRMNQYSRELQMGETTAVSFTVDVGTIQVYNAGIIYFAALAKTSEPLPLRELQLIAGELSRHTK